MVEDKELLEEEIKEIKKRSSVILVEGKNDKAALNELGLDNVIVLNETNKSVYIKIEDLIENAGKKEHIILTDIDKKGRRLYFMIKKKFSESGVKMNNKLRDLLIKNKVSHIEGLATFLNKPS
ncbi:toprim domain-containing protein [Candidatus Pacearchaeota archaeon]|nr:toprim domain-containing protein [Candidatus Pacearchaeota archaeon]